MKEKNNQEVKYNTEILPLARFDIAEIWQYTNKNYSLSQANKYIQHIDDAILKIQINPQSVPARKDLNPPVYLYACQKHYIIYRIIGFQIRIVRVMHHSQNWQDILS